MKDPDTEMDDADSSSATLLGVAMDSVITASLGPVGPLLRQLHPLTTQPEGVSEDEIQNLTRDLDELCISLMDHTEAEEPLSSTAKCWMSEVRELCYDTKNFFDDAPFISNQDLDDDSQLTPEEKQEISKLKFKELKDRASHAKDYQIDKPSNRKPKLASTRRRLPVLHPELIDRGRMDKLAALLRKDEEKQLKVVSVVGLEGVGKTTLVKRLYHQLLVQRGGQFECGAFVRVSPNPDMRRLLTTIFKQIQLPYSVSEGVSQPACCLDAQALITSIKDYLGDKRYFIIIDDLWSTSVWDVIRRAFPDDGCHSRIITTTQFKNVASACCSYQSKYIFEMQPLEDDQSRKLFSSMVFGSEDDDRIPEGIRKVTTEIIEKCNGLPLSIINIASLLLTEESEINSKQCMDVRNSLLCTLRRNPTSEGIKEILNLLTEESEINSKQCMDVRNSLPCTLRRNPTSEGIKEILNLIYNNLSPELKTCLLYLVVHPEGYTVNKGDLVKQWVIEGFIGEGQNKEEIAGWYFDELVSRGMIQAVDINCHGVLSCTLHHTVHNLIVNKSMEENFIISVDYFQSAMGLLDKVRRLSVQLAASRSARIPVGIMMSEVQSLAFFGFYGCVDFIEECKLLRVLILHVWADHDKVPFDLSGIISKLLPLRYVKIACNITVKLPAKIQNLQFLETLEVDTPVVSIPSDIGGLGRLSSLKIAVTELSREDIRILQKLRALTALSLHVCTTPVKMIVFDKEGFLVLKSFKFRCHLPWLKFEEGSMPDLRNLNLCFNAREADQHGIVPIGMEHMSGLKEITAEIWGSGTDVGSTFRTAINSHPSNPRIEVQLVDPIFHADILISSYHHPCMTLTGRNLSRRSKMKDPDTEMDDADSSSATLLGVAMDSVITASLGPVGPLLRQLHPLTTQPEGVSEDEIQNLTRDLDELCISLMDHTEAEEPLSSTAKCWMSEVRELCYDTKNFFDDAPFISNQDLDDDSQLTPEEKQEISKLKFKELKDRASHAKDYQIDKPSNRKPKLASTRRRLPVLHPELIDRGRMDKLAALLRKDEEKQLKVVSVVGLEGVGKTTLVKRLYHQLLVQRGGQFECGAFVRVSPNPDMRRLLTTIFKQIQLPYSVSEGVSQPACCLDAQALITSIKDYLGDKRYFIIIDDLWSTSVWDVIRRAFPDDGCHSRIITTTQFKNVASACCSYQSKYIFEMQPLEDDQSRKLFSSMVFGSEDDDRIPEGIRKVTTEIIEKCNGLPLSIINIASLLLTEESEINSKQCMDVRNSLLCTLRRNPTSEGIKEILNLLTEESEINSKQCMDVRNSLPCTLRRNPTSEGIKEILNLIYNNLSPELKTCLLYLVVHPEGYTVNKGDLVKQWVIEGFIGEGQNKEEIAGWYFDELVSRGMIQAVDINCHGVLSCTLHHTVHNLIVNKSMEENFIISVDYFQSAMGLLDKVRRLSVQLAASRSARIPVGIMMSEVQSLAFFGFYGCVDFIEECKLLRVLILHVWADHDKVPFDLSGIISKLLPLRYVKIACNITVKLPAKIQNLQFLETLEVDTPVVSIPSDIGGLGRLSSLKIAVTELSREDIRILQKLRALTALSLHVCTTPVKMIVFDKEGFLVLKSFKFRCHLPWLKFEEGSMPDLRNLNLCFNAREADQHGIVPIGMEHMSGLKEITAEIWGSGTDVGSTFRTAINSHPSNPRIEVQLVDPIFHADTTTSVGTIKVEDEKKKAADIRVSTSPRSKRTLNLWVSSSRVPVQGAYKKPELEKEIAQRMSELEVGSENEDMDTDQWMPSSPTNNQTDMNWETGCEDENKQADIRMCTTPGSSSRVPDSGADKRSKWKTETDNNEIMEETVTTSGEFVKLFQWIRSDISSRYSGWSGPREQELQGEILKLDERLQSLRDTLPKMYVLLDRAEWSSHEDYVVELLPNLKDAVYDAEDLLDEFKCYELKVTVEGNANEYPFNDFLNDVIKGSFNEKVQCIQDKLDNLSNQLEKIGLHQVRQRFDKSVRLETTCLLNETKIFGRNKEIKQVMRLLSKPKKSSGAQSANKDNDESKIPGLHVLPIVGIGGVGKTRLAQHVCNHPDIRSHFNLIIWICVSDDFDVMRLTKQALESCSGKRPTSDNLDILQDALSEHVRDKKVLIILDDLWGDAFKESGKYWKTFCAPLKNIGQKSLMLVTTRSPMVAHRVRTMKPFTLHGLKEDDAFWNFFKQCIFGSESSNNDSSLEHIGMSILPKLKGSPLAAQTVGLLLRMDLRASHWNYVLESELWELKQEKTDILPSLQLSYMYLPLHLKRCFAFCAVYRKDYRFEKRVLAEIWVAEGFVEPEGDIPATDIGCRYFQELVNESFFQEVSGSYIIPHLLHDMAQLVSRNDCFIIREKADFGKVPPDVRHLSILSGKDFDHGNLLSLCKHTKLRTLLVDEVDISAVIDHWCRGLHRLRVMCCGYTNELPDSIGNLKHLRYLEISGACPFNSLPSAFCYLYSLEIVDARECKLETLGGDLSKLISLRSFKSHGFDYSPGCVLKIDLVDWEGLGLGFIKNVSDVKDLCLVNLGKMSKNQAAEVELKNKQRLNSLELTWGRWNPDQGEKEVLQLLGPPTSVRDRDREVLQALEPPTSLKSLLIREYRGVSLPSWFGPQHLPSLTSLEVRSCDGLERMFLAEGTSLSRVSQRIDDLNEMPVEPLVDSNNDTTGIFSSLIDLSISWCESLSSLEQLVQPAYIPAIKKITIEDCGRLVSAGSFVGFRCLEELAVDGCPDINSQCLVAPSLKTLMLGNLADNIECCSLTSFMLAGPGLTSIQQQNWNLPALRELTISFCLSLRSIGQSVPTLLNPFVCGGTGSSINRGRFSSLTSLRIFDCHELSAIDNLLSEEYLPVIQRISVELCDKLVSLPVEIGSLSSLRRLEIRFCSSIRWPSGLVFPSSLEWLDLRDSGDMSACVPSCLENLTSLVSLRLWRCRGITVIPEKVWSSIRKSLQQLCIRDCPDLVSIGGARAIRKLRVVTIANCPKMEDRKLPQHKGSFDYDLWEGKSIW